MSSLVKVCPGCLGIHGAEVEVCSCGQKLAHQSETDSSLTCEVVQAQAVEHHYEEYCVARLDQAQTGLRALISQHGTSGWSPGVIREIEQAIQKVEQAKRDLEEQQARTSSARAAVDAASNRIAIRKIGALAEKKW